MNENFARSFLQMFNAIDLCIKNNLVIPSLCLIYSGIDAIAWVAYGNMKVGKRFEKFVEEHMYKEMPLSPKPIDLYAARCAVLHTMTPDSQLSDSKKAAPVVYAWGKAKIEELDKSINAIRPGELCAVHIADLSKSFRAGVGHFIENCGDDIACEERMAKHFSNLGISTVAKFNELEKA